MSAPVGEKATADVESSGSSSQEAVLAEMTAPPPFTISTLWGPDHINPLNGKNQVLNILNFKSQYTRNFHLSWLGFFVAFLSWFAFPPLIPEAIRTDLRLTTAQIGNSNIIALTATLVIRWFIGPVVDRYGPRLVMCAVLALGAIPSGLAGTISNYHGLYTIRFFIGILGATFVPCQAWTTAFYDKNCVGLANALVGGWGNLGGGVTFCVQVGLFEALVHVHNLTPHSAWRAAFAIVPVPILFGVAIATYFFGTDCPAGKWNMRHTLPATAIAAQQGHLAILDDKEVTPEFTAEKKEEAKATVVAAGNEKADIDVAVSEHLTMKSFLKVIASPHTWLPALMYMTTFGFELAIDANLANVFYAAHQSPDFGQTKAGFYASIYGFMNICFRAFGGYFGDVIYQRMGPTKHGVAGKKYFTMFCGFTQGVFALAMGLWQRDAWVGATATAPGASRPSLNIQIGLIIGMAIFGFMGNGANFALVPHCNSFNNGLMSGLVGGFGNLGGIFHAIMFRYHSAKGFADAFVIAGAFSMAVNALVAFIPAPKR